MRVTTSPGVFKGIGTGANSTNDSFRILLGFCWEPLASTAMLRRCQFATRELCCNLQGLVYDLCYARI